MADFKINVGQKRVLDLIKSPAREIMVSSGSRCFVGDTEVLTDKGYVQIKDIRKGDLVLSSSIIDDSKEFRKVNKVFRNSGQVKQMVLFVFNDGSKINCTIDHEIRKSGAYHPAIDIVMRVLDRGKWNERTVSGVEFGPCKNILLNGYERSGSTNREVDHNNNPNEINFDDVCGVYFYESKIDTYDLEVDVNHNYTVTRNNIIVSNSGKTFIIIWAILTIASKFPGSRHLIARKHFSHAKGSVWLDTLPKVIDICFPEMKPAIKYNNTDFFLQLPNGSELWVAGLDDKERVDKILGREYLTIFLNEASELSFDTYTTVKSRLAQKCFMIKPTGDRVEGKNMMLLDQNPSSSKHWTKLLFYDKIDPESKTAIGRPDRYVHTHIHPSENTENISQDYLDMLEGLPPAKRRRFLDGLFSDGSDNALWTLDAIADSRVLEMPRLRRIVVAVDPAVTATDKSDETGIVVQGIGIDHHLYTIADYTGKYTPNEWAALACQVYQDHNADLVVGEANNGGDLVETVIRQHMPLINYSKVHATKNKYTRAEPVSSLMFMKPAKHHIVGELPELELEMTEWEGKSGDTSPNRIDAMVWGAFALLPDLNPQRNQMRGNLSAVLKNGGRLF